MAGHLEFAQTFYDESWPLDEVTDQTEKLWRMLHAHPGLMNDFLYDEKVPGFSDHTQLDTQYPGWQFGEFAASVDRPPDSISEYLRTFNSSEQVLNSITKNVLTRVFAGNDFFATQSIHALELMEGLLEGKKRRTGEAEICHIERGLLRLIVSAAKAQRSNREERHSFHVEKIPSLLVDALKAGDERKQVDIAEVDQFIGEKTFNLRPFNSENLPITCAAIVAFIFHDFQEDFNSKGFSFHQNGNSLIIRHREKNTLEEVAQFKFGLKYPHTAKITKRMMDAYTRPTFKPGILTDDEDSQKQVLHLLDMLGFEDLDINRELAMRITLAGKRADRMDNLDTYWDNPTSVIELMKSQEKRQNKLLESWRLFSVVDLYTWGWESFEGTDEEGDFRYPPAIQSQIVLRELGATLNDVYHPSFQTAKRKQDELKLEGFDSIIIPDPYLPVVVTENGDFIPIVAYGRQGIFNRLRQIRY